MPKPPKAPRRFPDDIAILHGPTEDGEGARLLRLCKGELSAGEVRPAREGQPIGGHEVVRLQRLGPDPRVCAVEVLHAPAARSADAPRHRAHGPARVATETYRRNWGQIFRSPRANKSRDLVN
jgi:hypothetical protein